MMLIVSQRDGCAWDQDDYELTLHHDPKKPRPPIGAGVAFIKRLCSDKGDILKPSAKTLLKEIWKHHTKKSQKDSDDDDSSEEESSSEEEESDNDTEVISSEEVENTTSTTTETDTIESEAQLRLINNEQNIKRELANMTLSVNWNL